MKEINTFLAFGSRLSKTGWHPEGIPKFAKKKVFRPAFGCLQQPKAGRNTQLILNGTKLNPKHNNNSYLLYLQKLSNYLVIPYFR